MKLDIFETKRSSTGSDSDDESTENEESTDDEETVGNILTKSYLRIFQYHKGANYSYWMIEFVCIDCSLIGPDV